MDLLIAFAIFLICMISSLIADISTVPALIAGFVAFFVIGLRRKFRPAELFRMAGKSVGESLIVLEVMAVIGFLTASWRMSGTITVFVYYGMQLITPKLFILITFLLSSLLSYAIGTSFGVAGTVGVIFMALARAGGVDPLVTAGTLMSGVFFGDRSSPVSSSAHLVCSITGTNIYDNVKAMMKTGAVPFFVSLVLYLVVSINNPIQGADSQMMAGLQEAFVISYWAFLPAVLTLVLPLFKVDVLLSMGLSILSSVLISIFVQGQGIMEVVRTLIFGYKAGEGTAASILDGGGLLSMVEIIIILLVSGAYSGIFEGTDMLRGVNEKISSLCIKIGRLPVTMIMGLGSAMVFCNQTIATLMVGSLMKGTYRESGASGEELAIDMENSVILISCMVPWCIGCSVPLGFFGVGWSAMKYAFYMFLVPIVYLFTKRFFYGSKKHD